MERLRANDVHPVQPGDAVAFTLDRLARVQKALDSGAAVLTTSPAAGLEAKRQGKLALLPALEGADGLEGSLELFSEIAGPDH